MLFLQHKNLIAELVRREFIGKYQGSFGGMLWPLLQPLLLLIAYTVAFGWVLNVRWGLASDAKTFAFMLFAGLILFNAFSECLIRGPGLVTANPNFVKKVVFPLDILPIVQSLTSLITAFISLLIWIAGYLAFFGLPPATLVWFPLVLISFYPVLLGVGWLLAGFGVLVRDLPHLSALFSQVFLFLTPVFYGMETAPPLLRRFLFFNPLSFPIEQLRCVLFYGRGPDVAGLALYFALASLFALAALFLFRRLRPAFADFI